MSNRILFSVVGLLFPLVAFAASSGDEPKNGLPEAALKILSAATRVECFRIGPQSADKSDGQPVAKRIDIYPISSTAKEQGRDFSDKLTAVLKDEKSYGPPARCFSPGVGLRAWNGKESVDVIICYKCRDFLAIARNAEGKEIARSQSAGFAKLPGFPGNWAAFVQLARTAFPDDADIQKLDPNKDWGETDPK